MRFGKAVLVAALAASMTSAPVLAQANGAQSLSVASRSGAQVSGQSSLTGNSLIPLGIVIAIIVAGLLSLRDGNRTRSP